MGRRYEQDQPAAEPAAVSLSDLGVAGGLAPSMLPRLAKRPAVLFLFHPERWQVLDGQVVPSFGPLVLQAGVGGVKPRKPHGVDITDALAQKARRGWTLVPLDVDGPGTGYLHMPLPGVYLTRWETANAGSSHITSDLPGFAAWCRSLIRRGKVPPPAPYVLEALASRYRSEVLALQDQVRTVPSAQVRLDHALKMLDAVEREGEGLDLVPAPSAPVADPLTSIED